ncbi:MAG: NAD(P)/FAD-dependent oxidoreductase [Archangiaceae bacterium]|nr:NAD(P)/FAD-dependent oxidoreductase [Archangiaceae bacterium]
MAGPAIPTQCDVAIIGGGVAGLTAGALLARAGLSAVVLERESRPGGYLAGFHRKGFVFDSAIHWLNQCGRGGMVHKVFHSLGDDPPEAPVLERIRRYKGDSFDYLLTHQPDALKEQLARDFPSEAKGLDRFFKLSRVLGERITGYARYMRTADTLSFPEWVGRGLQLMGWSYPFWRLVGDRDCKALSKFFHDEDLKKIFCSEPDILSCLVPIGWAYTGDFQRPPRGGSQSFIKWLMRRVGELGSVVALRTAVQSVTTDQRGVSGVKLADGREVKARWVIGACDLDALFTQLLPSGAVPDDLVARYRAAELYNSCVTLSIGLDCDPRALGLGEEMIFLTKDGVPREQHNSGDPHTSGLSILAPSIRDPSLAPAGKGTVTVYCEAHIGYADRWKTGPDLERGPAYQQLKRDYAQVIIDRVDARVAPGLKAHIELLDVATPITHLRYTGNRDGTIMAQRTTKANMKAKVAGYRTPVDRLLVGGQWAEYGGGVPMAVKAAANAAAIVLKQEKPQAFRQLCQVLDQPLS